MINPPLSCKPELKEEVPVWLRVSQAWKAKVPHRVFALAYALSKQKASQESPQWVNHHDRNWLPESQRSLKSSLL